MSEPYEERVDGETLLRMPPGVRHELICSRLHEIVAVSLAGNSTARLLERRSAVRLSAKAEMRPDLALITVATGKLWLAAEIVSPDDHRTDTVIKKLCYEDMNIPRLWMIDPRYDNVEVYHGTPYGLALKGILAGKEILAEQLLPALKLTIAELFQE